LLSFNFDLFGNVAGNKNTLVFVYCKYFRIFFLQKKIPIKKYNENDGGNALHFLVRLILLLTALHNILFT